MQQHRQFTIRLFFVLWLSALGLMAGCQPVRPVPIQPEVTHALPAFAQVYTRSGSTPDGITANAASLQAAASVDAVRAPMSAQAAPVQVAPMPPVRLKIPAIGVDAAVEFAGLTAQGQMEAPHAYDNVAWYADGPVPGTPGNAVISGHLDDPNGPAVFWRLGDLEPGDEITVVDEQGSERVFAVLAVETYPFDDSPLNKIFGYDVRRNLNLITCEGVWNQATGNYNQRLVVYTRQVDEPNSALTGT